MSTTYLTSLQSINHQISITAARTLISRFDTNRPAIIAGDFSTLDPLTKSQTFEKEQILSLLDQEGCVGLRIYNGMYGDEDAPSNDHKNKIVFVLCGVDENGNDLDLAWTSTSTNQIILETAQMCEPFCSSPSQINNL